MNNIGNIKRAKRIRKKLKRINTDRFRLSVFKSSKNISAQIIDDKTNNTLVSASSMEKNIKQNLTKAKKIETSKLIGEVLAKRAAEKKIKKIFFDRGGYKYHGRIKLFAETLKKNGIIF